MSSNPRNQQYEVLVMKISNFCNYGRLTGFVAFDILCLAVTPSLTLPRNAAALSTASKRSRSNSICSKA